MTTETTRFFFSPLRIVTGAGCVGVVGDELKRLRAGRALVVTDGGVRDAGIAEIVTRVLADAEIPFIVFDGVKPNPTVANVLSGLDALEGASGDPGIVAVGGGSVMDCAKMIGALATNGGAVQDYDGVDLIPKRMLPMVAVNTTAGTASEVTRWSVITDPEREVKMAIGDENLLPDVAVDDPELTLGLPPRVTAQTGMDALTHAIEGYVGTGHTPLTDGMATEAIRQIALNLETAVHRGKDIAAREAMMYAQAAAGLAFQNAGVGNVHAMAHQLGAVHDMPHGLANAVILPYVMEFNLPACAAKFAHVAGLMGIETQGLSERDAAMQAVSAVARLNAIIGIPANLGECGIKDADLDLLARKTMDDGAMTTNPRETSLEQMRILWRNALEGRLDARPLA